jgi:hypothetical protein
MAAGIATAQIKVIRAELPAYVQVPHQPLEDSILRNVRRVAATLINGREPAPAEVHEAWVARERAEQGVPADEVIRAYQLSLGMLRDTFIEQARLLQVDPVAIMQGTHLLWRLSDTVTMCLIEVRREVELEKARYNEHHRLDFLRRLLLGSVTPADLYDHSAMYHLMLDRPYLAFRGRTSKPILIEPLKYLIETSGRLHGLPAFVGIIDGDIAGVAPRRPELDGFDATIGVGPLSNLEAIAHSFQSASRMLEVAMRFSQRGTYGLEDLSLQVSIATEHDLGMMLRQRYLAPLAAEGAFGELLERTLRCFLQCGQQIGRTAQELAIHPNTLRYRLGRFEELTGAELSRPQCMVELWWALEHERVRA